MVDGSVGNVGNIVNEPGFQQNCSLSVFLSGDSFFLKCSLKIKVIVGIIFSYQISGKSK